MTSRQLRIGPRIDLRVGPCIGLCIGLLLTGCGGDARDVPHPRREREPTPEELLERGVAAYRDGRLEEAATLLGPLTGREGVGARAQNLLGMILAAQDSLQPARHAFKMALDLDPDLAVAHNNLGALYALDRRDAFADVAFAQAVALDSSYPQPHRGLALVALRRGRLDKAEQHAARARGLERSVDATVLAGKAEASIQSLALWPWKNVEALIRAEARRRAEAQPAAGPPGTGAPRSSADASDEEHRE